MSQIFQLLDKAVQQRATELLLLTEHAPKARSVRNWIDLDSEQLKGNQMRSLINESIDDEERERLHAQGFLEGTFFLNEKRINFTYSVTQQGFSAHFKWNETTHLQMAQWNFPAFVLDGMLKGSSLSIVAGPKNSGKTAAALAIFNELLSKRKVHGTMFADRLELSQMPDQGSYCSYDAKKLLSSRQLNSDITIVDSVDWAVIRGALELAEMGGNVLITVPRSGVRTAIERLSEEFEARPSYPRLAAILHAAFGVNLIPGIEPGAQSAFELFVGTPLTKHYLSEGNWEQVGEVMASSGEKTGMRTMNQALLQLVLKRKIEIRQAFEASPKPDELDQLLKKVGF